MNIIFIMKVIIIIFMKKYLNSDHVKNLIEFITIRP